VSQISPPIRIVLVAAVAFLAAYMLFLRPKEEPIPAAEPAPNVETGEPAVSDPGKVAEAAQEAADAASAQVQAQESVDGVDAGESAAATGAASKGEKAGSGKGAAAIPADLEGVPKPVAEAIGKEKTLVLLFWNDRAADDREVRQALRKVDRWDGRVFTHAAPISKISRYGRITRGVGLEQSPTIAVVDTELRAETVVGYVDAATIDQMVIDAFRNSTGLFDDEYLAELNDVCLNHVGAMVAMPDWGTPREYGTLVSGLNTRWGRFVAEVKAIDPPKKWRSFHRGAVRDVKAAGAVYADLAAFVGRKPSATKVVAAHQRFQPQFSKLNNRIERRMDSERVFGCGTDA
jgi:hypothetical protein